MFRNIAWGLVSAFLLAANGSLAQESVPDQKNLPDYSNQKRLEWLYQTRLGNASRMFARFKTWSKGAGDFADSTLSARMIPSFLNTNPSVRERADEFLNPPSKDGGKTPPIESYNTFNEFFTRALSEKGKALRPFDQSPLVVASPADSALFVIPDLQPDSDFFVKGSKFNLRYFLGCNQQLAKKFEGGTLMLFYLAPVDYHRFHFPFDATITSGPTTISGELDSVDPIAYTPTAAGSAYSNSLFVVPGTDEANKPFSPGSHPLMTNERRLFLLNSKEFGDVALMAVGAMMVGSIRFTFDPNKREYKKGDEMGLFAFGGSTIVLLFEKGRVNIPKRFLKPLPEYQNVYMMYSDNKNPTPDRPKTKIRLGESVAFSQAGIAPPKVGFCHVDSNNYFILKTADLPGWDSTGLCYATDGTVTDFNSKPCKGGGSKEICEALIK